QNATMSNTRNELRDTSAGGACERAAARMDRSVAGAGVVAPGTEPNWDANHRPLLVKMVDGGVSDTRYTGANAVRDAAAHHWHTVSELPRAARRLQDGEPTIPTVFELH